MSGLIGRSLTLFFHEHEKYTKTFPNIVSIRVEPARNRHARITHCVQTPSTKPIAGTLCLLWRHESRPALTRGSG